MPALIAWFYGAITYFAGNIALLVGREAAIRITIIAAISLATTTLLFGVNAAIDSLLTAAPSFVQVGASWIIPEALPTLASTYLSFRASVWIYNMVVGFYSAGR